VDSHKEAIQRIRAVADYQFGRGIGKRLFPDEVEIQFSRATGRIRYVYFKGERLATYRPTDGYLSLSIVAAQRLVSNSTSLGFLVTVRSDVAGFIAEGGDVFAVHVVKVGKNVRPKDEVIIMDEDGAVIGVGRALLSASEMLAFKTGVAVKVRHGCSK
jgi:conserved protein with predicted RNA binding PUA domain